MRARAAAGRAVAGPGEAGVVAVAAQLAGGRGADVLVPALWAGDQSAEVIIRGRGGAAGVSVAAGGQNLLTLVEQRPADQRRVRVRGGDVAEADFAEVEPVGQHPADGVPGPRLAGSGAVTLSVEPVGDGSGTGSGVGVEREDLLYDVLLLGMRDQPVGVGVDEVAVGAGAVGPLPAGGFAFHPGDDAVDEHFPFELGERAEHLHEQPPRGGAGVERFGRRSERDAGVVQVVHQGARSRMRRENRSSR
jgi:hypothetical protein